MSQEELKKQEEALNQKDATTPDDKEKSTTTEDESKDESSEHYKNNKEGQNSESQDDVAFNKFKERKLKREDTKPEADFDSKLNEMEARLRAELRAEKDAESIKAIASSDDEAERIEFILETKIRRTDNFQEDLANAKFLANKSQYEELQKETGAMASARNSGNRTSSAKQGGDAPTQYNDQELALFAKFGLDPTK